MESDDEIIIIEDEDQVVPLECPKKVGSYYFSNIKILISFFLTFNCDVPSINSFQLLDFNSQNFKI